jgi:hypothetical protein
MYESDYDLSSFERQEAAGILGEMQLRGGKLADERGRQVHYRVLGGRRFLLCERGWVWRFAASGSPSVPGLRGGSVRRNSAIEMWTGKWRRAGDRYEKCLVWVPMDDNVNGRQDVSKIGWYLAEKGFRHPLDGPPDPDARERAALDERAAAAAEAVGDRLAAEGLAGAADATASGSGGPRSVVAADEKDGRDGERPSRTRCGTIAAIRMPDGRFASTKGSGRGC